MKYIKKIIEKNTDLFIFFLNDRFDDDYYITILK